MAHPYLIVVNRFALWFRRSFSFLWLMALALYLCVLAGQAVFKNYQSKQDTEVLEEKLAALKLEHERLDALLVYYQTDDFKKKELRRTMVLKEPGEKVYALPESSLAREVEAELREAAKSADTRRQQPVWKQWYEYILHGDSGSQQV